MRTVLDLSHCGISLIPAGADPEAEIGEVHNPETHLIPLALDVVLGRREELAVFGNGYPTPDGTCIRDYIHVTDLARAHVISLKQLENKGPVGLSVNLGTGKGTSVFEIINACKEIGGKVNYRIAPAREGDPPVLVADPIPSAQTTQLESRLRGYTYGHSTRLGIPEKS